MLLLLLSGGPGGPVLKRAPAGAGYSRAVLTVARPTATGSSRPAQPNTTRP